MDSCQADSRISINFMSSLNLKLGPITYDVRFSWGRQSVQLLEFLIYSLTIQT